MIIKSKRVYITGVFVPAEIEVTDGKIESILAYDAKEADVDYGDLRIVPGFIDIHCHGAYGFDTDTADEAGLRNWTKGIVQEGVVGFLATTLTQMHPVLEKALKNVAKVYHANDYEGARILGVHFEGPYLDMKHKGAQPPEAIVAPNVEEFKQYQQAADGLIKVITMACEHDTDFALTKYASQHGVIVSMGHSDTTFEQAVLAVANGAKSITHTYNAMTPFTHRQNGLVGVALRMHDLYSEVICDLNHSTADALHIFFTSKDRDKCIMISDALMCKGFKPGSVFDFGGHDVVIYPDGSAHLVKEKNLAGSTMKMNEGLRNVVEKAMVPFDVAINACTINPARMLKVDDHLGRICSGYDASFVVLEDNYEVKQTYVLGVPQL